MFTLELDDFMFELKDGALKHVGTSNKTATAKLYDIDSVDVRGFGDQRVKVTCTDDSGNEIEVALDPAEAKEIANEIEQLKEESGIFE